MRKARHAADYWEAEHLAGLRVRPDARVELADGKRQDDAGEQSHAESHCGRLTGPRR